MEFKGKVVVITGPAKGMGSAITLAFARQGARLALLGRDTRPIEAVATEARAAGAEAMIAKVDLIKEQEVRDAVERAAAAFDGRIDVLVTVAGVSGPLDKLTWETTQGEYDEVMDVNVRGIFLAMKYVIPVMIRQGGGKIVNIGGTYGLQGKDYRSIYSASKWALRGLTRSAALEAGKFNININLVCPGSTEGPRLERVINATATRTNRTYDQVRAMYEGSLATGRIATAEDVANATLFMASEHACSITGHEIPVDGGSVLLTFPPNLPKAISAAIE